MYPAYDNAVRKYCAMKNSRRPSVTNKGIRFYAPSRGGAMATAMEAGALNDVPSIQRKALIFYDEMFSTSSRTAADDSPIEVADGMMSDDESSPASSIVGSPPPSVADLEEIYGGNIELRDQFAPTVSIARRTRSHSQPDIINTPVKNQMRSGGDFIHTRMHDEATSVFSSPLAGVMQS